jgi:hypothetical protein
VSGKHGILDRKESRVGRTEKEEAMARYENRGGDSPIVSYEFGEDSIKLGLIDGSFYLYNYHSAGSANIEQMKKYAIIGHGLHGFIKRFVRKEAGIKLD